MTLAHEVAGTGPTVLLLHSTVCDRRMWEPQVPDLVAAGFRVVRCDLRGYGSSPLPDAAYDDATDVLELAGAERFALVGASGGGQVAQAIAARWPSRVTGLALLCAAMEGHEPSSRLRAFGSREDELLTAGDVEGATELNVDTWVGPAADEAVRSLVRVMQRRAFEVQLAAPAGASTIEVPYDVAAVTAPTLVVSGAHDLPDFREIAVTLAGRIAGARHVELSWAGHLPSLERPAALNPLLIDFLRSVH